MTAFADIQFKTGEDEPTRAKKLRMLTDQIQLFATKKASSTVPVGTISWDNITGKPTTFPPSAHEQPFSSITGEIDPAQVPEDAVTQFQSDLEINASQISGLPPPFSPAAAVAAVAAASEATATIAPSDTGGVLTWDIVPGGIPITALKIGDPDVLFGTDDSGNPTEIIVGAGLELLGGVLTTFGAISAAGVTFDDSDTLYDATNVQDALDWIDRGANDQYETAGFDQRARIAAGGMFADSATVQWLVDTGDGLVQAIVVGGGSGGQGPPGVSGIDGNDGEEGPMGPPGPPGTSGGPPGPTGATGPQGVQGFMGATGLDGTDGEDSQPIPGPPGATGLSGAAGAMGPPGMAGDDGYDGEPGPPGAAGAAGAAGAVGPAGPPGPPGEEGPEGEAGPPGPNGPVGPAGTGAQGPAGPPGLQGEDGVDGEGIIQLVQSQPATSLLSTMLADSPFALWKCDDASTALADSSGNGFNLTTVNGTPSYQFTALIPSLPTTAFLNLSGFVNSTGSANGFQLTSLLGRSLPLTTWSLEFTYCPFANSNTRMFLWATSATTAVMGVFITSSTLEVLINNAIAMSSGVTLQLGKVTHVVLTCSTTAGTSTLILYQNGVKVATATASASTATGGTSIAGIGDITNGGTTGGLHIGYVGLFPTVLSAARVAAHAAAAGMLGL